MPDRAKAAAFFLLSEGVWLAAVPALAAIGSGSWWPGFRGPAAVAFGAALVAAGAALAIWAHYHLITVGGGTPLPIRPPERLVTTGPYAHVRNPASLGLAALTIGATIAVDEPGVWVLPAVAAVYAVMQAGGERAQLRERFGVEYADYRARVPAWFPAGS